MTLLDQLSQAGAFAHRAPIATEIKVAGKTFTAYFRDLPGVEVRKILFDKGEARDRDVELLDKVLCDEAGAALLDRTQIESLKLEWLAALASGALRALGIGQEGGAEAKKR